MPSNVVKTEEDEEKWEKAKEKAEEQGQGDNYAYIMSIYKNMCPSGVEDSNLPDHCSSLNTRHAAINPDNMRDLYKDLLRLGSMQPPLRPKIYPLLAYLEENMR